MEEHGEDDPESCISMPSRGSVPEMLESIGGAERPSIIISH